MLLKIIIANDKKEVQILKYNIAVDETLSPVAEILERNGYNIIQQRDKNADAIIVDGIDDNMMGMEDIVDDVPVINADGKTPQEVLRELEDNL